MGANDTAIIDSDCSILYDRGGFSLDGYMYIGPGVILDLDYNHISIGEGSNFATLVNEGLVLKGGKLNISGDSEGWLSGPYMTNSGSFNVTTGHIGNNNGGGLLTNTSSGVMNFSDDIHLDGSICNEGLINMAAELLNHGGHIDCCGHIETPMVEVSENDGRPGTFECIDICWGGDPPGFRIKTALLCDADGQIISGGEIIEYQSFFHIYARASNDEVSFDPINTTVCGQNLAGCDIIYIDGQPADQLDQCPGSDATFAIDANSEGVFTYTWQKDGIPLVDIAGEVSGSTTSTLTILGIDAQDAGRYHCLLTNDCGDIPSDTAELRLDSEAPQITDCPADRLVSLSGGCELQVPDLTGEVVATDNCVAAFPVVISQDPAAGTMLPSGNSSTHVVVITAEDGAGNTASCNVNLIGEDIGGPVLANPPEDVTVDCISDVPAMTDLGWTDDCDGSGRVTGSDASDGNTCPEVITRTWTFTDASGNSSSVSQLITIEDLTPPVFVSPPADVTVSCESDVPVMTDLTWLDNCDGTGTVTGTDVSDGNTCPKVIMRTWTYTDACGNTSSASQYITIDDTTPPTATAPPLLIVECISDVPSADITLITDEADNCTASPVVEHVGDVSDEGSCPRVITRTYSVTDDCGNELLLSQMIAILDLSPPVFEAPPSDVTVSCEADIPLMTDLAWTDNCDGTGTIYGTDVSDEGSCPEVIIRTWTYTDACGNTSSASQTITIDDTTPPTATAPADIEVECAADIPAANIMLITDEADNCSAVPVVAHVSDVSDNGTCPEIITRIYSITDDCGNQTLVTQKIKVQDLTAPILDIPPGDVTVECGDDVPMIDLNWTDNCDGTGTVTGTDVSDGGSCPELITRTWTYTDACGNTSGVSQTITVYDITPPTATNPAPLFVECVADIPAADITLITDEADNCTAVPAVAHVSDVSDGNTCPEVITRTYSITDDCGNETLLTQEIIIRDITVPEFSEPPANVTVGCEDELPVMIDLSWTDNCDGAGTVSGTDVSDNGTCPEMIIRTWTYTDACGNTSSVSQIITIDDTTPPSAKAPAAITVECVGDIPPANIADVTNVADNCTAVPVVAHVSDFTDGTSCPLVIVRTYSVTDDCGNQLLLTQLISVLDITPPVFESPPPDETYECAGDIPAMTELSWTDNCDIGGTEPGMDASDGNTCPETITRTWTYTDACGNTGSTSQTFTILDITPPSATGPADITVECLDDVPVADVSAVTGISDNCSAEPVVSHVEDVSNGGSCPEIITRTYRVADGCGNEILLNQLITIHDLTPPEFLTPPVDVSLQCIDELPSAELAWTDNCDGVGTVAGVDVSDGNNCPEVITRTWTYTDVCGNSTGFSQTITIDDTTPPTASAPLPVLVECSADVPEPDIADVTNVQDNCTANPVVVHKSDVSDGGHCPEVITRTYSVTDDCGNELILTQLIRIDDTTPPTATAPANITVQCRDEVPPPDVGLIFDATDNCSAAPVVAFVSDLSDGTTCKETIVRTYSVTDDCGNELLLRQTITVDDLQPPVLEDPPADITVTCPEDIPAMIELAWMDNCDGAGTVTGIDISDGFFPETLTRTWTYADACGNESSVSQMIVVDDADLPEITVCPPDRIVLLDDICALLVPDLTGEVVALDNCTENADLAITQVPQAGTLLPSEDGNVHIVVLEVDDGNGNMAECQINLVGSGSICVGTIQNVPDAFSPNGDGVNDVWVIQGIQAYPRNHIQVYGRSGALLYETNGYNNTDIVFEGYNNTSGTQRQLPDGTYFYIIDLGDGSSIMKGYLVINR